MSVTAEQLLEQAQKVLEARGFRVVQVGEATEAEAKATQERSEANAASASEDEAITAFKQLANDYTKE
jgi:acetolactate synthase regulatory subunit